MTSEWIHSLLAVLIEPPLIGGVVSFSHLVNKINGGKIYLNPNKKQKLCGHTMVLVQNVVVMMCRSDARALAVVFVLVAEQGTVVVMVVPPVVVVVVVDEVIHV